MFSKLFRTQKVTVVIPMTTKFYNVRDHDGRMSFEVEEKNQKIYIDNPIIKVSPEIRKVFDICSCPLELAFEYELPDTRFVLEFSTALWKEKSIQQKVNDLYGSVLRSKQPHLMVPGKKVIAIEQAINDLTTKLMTGEEK